MKPIVIVGAGITGCVAAFMLAQKGFRVLIIEKEPRAGGLSKTFRYEDFAFDVGPHRFYSQKQPICDFIKDVLGPSHTILTRNSDVYFYGKYHSWPLRPSVLFHLPLKITLKSGWDLFALWVKNSTGKVETFEQYILTNYGPSLYNIFFKDFTQKFLGCDPRDIHYQWAKEGLKRTIIDERIASRNLLDIFKLFFRFKPIKTEFIYPDTGTGSFCDKLVQRLKAYGAGIRTSSQITRVKSAHGKIEQIYLNEEEIHPAHLVWTGPLGSICGLLDLPFKGLEYLSLLLFNIEISRPVNKSFQWCYYGSKELIFSRVTIPASFNKAMAPQGKAGLCVEVTCKEGDRSWNDPEALIRRVKKDLVKVGLLGQINEASRVHIEKVPDAYPLYSRCYPQALEKVKQDLGRFNNLMPAGRTGLFWYNNMDDSIENGFQVAEDIERRI